MSTEPEASELDPTEDVGPEHCEPAPQEVEARPSAGDPPEACEWNIRDEVEDAYAPEQTLMVSSPVDGLPIPAQERSSRNLVLAPDYSYAHVCIADDREYVELFRQEVDARGISTLETENVSMLLRGLYLNDGTEADRARFPKERVVRRWGHAFVVLTETEAETLHQREKVDDDTAVEPSPQTWFDDVTVLLAVRPRRERCECYKRQLFNHDGHAPTEKSGKLPFANCIHPARRSLGGAAMSLRDQTVYACEYRSPPDPESVARELDQRERERLATEVEMVPLFGLK
jgi:hypothetical protein